MHKVKIMDRYSAHRLEKYLKTFTSEVVNLDSLISKVSKMSNRVLREFRFLVTVVRLYEVLYKTKVLGIRKTDYHLLFDNGEDLTLTEVVEKFSTNYRIPAILNSDGNYIEYSGMTARRKFSRGVDLIITDKLYDQITNTEMTEFRKLDKFYDFKYNYLVAYDSKWRFKGYILIVEDESNEYYDIRLLNSEYVTDKTPDSYLRSLSKQLNTSSITALLKSSMGTVSNDTSIRWVMKVGYTSELKTYRLNIRLKDYTEFSTNYRLIKAPSEDLAKKCYLDIISNSPHVKILSIEEYVKPKEEINLSIDDYLM